MDIESNHLSDQDITQFLKDVKPLAEHIELWVNYMWHVRPVEADWAMVDAYFDQILLQDSILVGYADRSRYKIAWKDVDQVFMPINEIDTHWYLVQLDLWSGVVTFYDSGITYDHEWRDWCITLRECLQAQIRHILLDGYSVLDVKAVIFKCLCLSSRMRAFLLIFTKYFIITAVLKYK
ncbi:phospholipase-like protein [Tanacetum coccineum]|uniref:Phospholipase-like protein n=1 Tax=Tanacetum coccineum TaxID=301880 RepID=A0ABQ5F8H5_9ASTR